MAGDLQIVPALPEHAEELALTMREEDRLEVWRVGHRMPLRALLDSMAASDQSWAALWGGRVGALYGTAPMVGMLGTAAPWLITGEVLEHNKRSFLREAHRGLEQMLARWPRLLNVVCAECPTALRWVRWMGFAVGPPFQWGPDSAFFHWIERRAP